MPDRRVGDWRNGVDVDEELTAWRTSTRRALGVFAIGVVIALGFLAAFAVVGNGDGVFYMATAVFFMALTVGVLTFLGRRAA